jgi:hypothetical protein
MLPIAQSDVLVALCRQVGQGMAQRIDQAEADDVAGALVAGRGDAEVRAAAWMLATMAPVESISVPSQSKTISSKRLPIVPFLVSIQFFQ